MSDTAFLPGTGPTTTPAPSLVTPDNLTIVGDGTVKAPLHTPTGLYTESTSAPDKVYALTNYANSDLTAGVDLLAGNILSVDSSSRLQLGKGDTIAHSAIVGFAPMAFSSGAPAGYFRSGPLTLTEAQWEAVNADGADPLTPGSNYWLSGTAGKITATQPTGGTWDVKVGVALTATTLDVNIGQPVSTS